MEVTGIHHLGIAVEDLESGIEQYRRLLGAEVGEIFIGGSGLMRASFVKVGGLDIELIQPLKAESNAAKIVAQRGYGINHLAVKVGDFDGAVAELRSQGVKFMNEPRTTSFGERAIFTEAASLGEVNLEVMGK